METLFPYTAQCFVLSGTCFASRSSSSISLSWCRGRFPWSRLLSDQKDSPATLRRDDRCPCCAGCAASQVVVPTCRMLCSHSTPDRIAFAISCVTPDLKIENLKLVSDHITPQIENANAIAIQIANQNCNYNQVAIAVATKIAITIKLQSNCNCNLNCNLWCDVVR